MCYYWWRYEYVVVMVMIGDEMVVWVMMKMLLVMVRYVRTRVLLEAVKQDCRCWCGC